ncbi:carboxyl transferase domain-containing protein [Nocardioides convexus]|uniref:carboxyl transferase domain-containing protein n=1 Tax=Nocardioides convexus TaxID=2712224 RepID=UPI00241832BD|nr:carboxyl transferase domain-containing protein [Nocardioides convexus]
MTTPRRSARQARGACSPTPARSRPGTWRPSTVRSRSGTPPSLTAAAERSGLDEAVLTGEATVDGHRVALVVSEFGFLAGSIGRATADRIVAAVERATAAGLPLLGLPASGGTRMQEGTPAFVRMAGIAAAVAAHRAAGLPYLVFLRHPTTGGVMASWASLGHVTIAEPGALVGFLGPKVYRALEGEDFPAEVQTSENLHRHGIVDGVGSVEDFRDVVRRVLGVLAHPGSPTAAPALPEPAAPDAWDAITRTRQAGRPGVRESVGGGSRRRRRAARQRRGRDRPRPGPGARHARRHALRRGGPRPHPRRGVRAGGAARRRPRDAPGGRFAAPAGHRRRHPRRRALGRGRGGRARRSHRPLDHRPGHPAHTHRLRPARRGHRRGSACPAARGQDRRHRARLALPAAARGGQRDPPRRHQPRRRDGPRPAGRRLRPSRCRAGRPDRPGARRRGRVLPLGGGRGGRGAWPGWDRSTWPPGPGGSAAARSSPRPDLEPGPPGSARSPEAPGCTPHPAQHPS